MINPGAYNVFQPDGTLLKWGAESVYVKVTTYNRACFFVGDNTECLIEKYIPKTITRHDQFDAFTRMVFESAIMLHATHLVLKLHKYQDAYRQICDQKAKNLGLMKMDLMPTWRWIEEVERLNEYLETCEDLMKETMEELRVLAPDMLSSTFTIIFGKA